MNRAGDSRSILLQSQDRTQTVLIDAFTPAPGESGQAHLLHLAQERAALFPDAQLTHLAPQPSAGHDLPVLTQIVKSLRFMAPRSSMAFIRKNKKGFVQTAAITRSLHYVTWSARVNRASMWKSRRDRKRTAVCSASAQRMSELPTKWF